MKNQLIAKILYNIADILELQEIQWKPQAYRNAAQTIESLSEDIAEIYKRNELDDLPGIGEHISKKIIEIIKTGKLKYYTKLKRKVKVDIESLQDIPALGPKKIKILYKKLGVKNIKDLQKVIKKGKLRKLTGFGEKTEHILAEGIEFVKSNPQRFLYGSAVPVVNEILNVFRKEKFVQKIEVAGSFRRGKETVGDLDFLVISKQPKKVMNLFTSLPDVKKVISKGTTRASVLLNSGMQIDLRVVQAKEFGSAMNYFVGSKAHNVELRKLCLKKNYTLSEYGLFKLPGKKWVAGRSEEEIYKKLGLQFIPPELRENSGEITLAKQKKLPDLVSWKNVNGVFHHHSKWTDGVDSILKMAQIAEELNWKFISFNDHYGNVMIANPLNERRLAGYMNAISLARKKTKIKIYSGLEIDIMKNGTLPLSNKQLKKFDVIIAAVHMATRQSEKVMTKRVCSVLENYPVNILAHPTDVLLNERPGLKINLDKVFSVAKQNNVFLEINASPKRMDLSGELVKKALDVGCKFALGNDAHAVEQMELYKYGLLMARRGWCERKDILNCLSLPKIEKELKR
jgi:DNA polymerase (family X)